MKNISEIMKECGIEVDDDTMAKVDAAVKSNYKTINEFEKVSTDAKDKAAALAAAEKDRDEAKDIIEKLGDIKPEDIPTMRSELEAFRASEKQREEEARKNAEESNFNRAMDAAIGDREFTNSFVRNSIYAEARKMAAEKPELGYAEIVDTLTKDVADVWANPNKPDPNPLPAAASGSDAAAVESARVFL